MLKVCVLNDSATTIPILLPELGYLRKVMYCMSTECFI